MREANEQSFLTKLWGKISDFWKKEIDVYFVSGMCYNCKVFDGLTLPKGYQRHYLEWRIPDPNDSFHDYILKMAENINTKRPFVLIGYSLGGVAVQEMLKFLCPVKSIIISSFKSAEEAPTIFYVARKTQVLRRTPLSVYSTDFVTKAFNKVIYDLPALELADYMTIVDPVYIKWAAIQITEWLPENSITYKNMYHIHGTEDQIFPYHKIENAYPIEGGDHLMLVKKTDEMSHLLNSILLKKD